MNSEKFISTEEVKEILASPEKYEWTRQGLGMLRTYISDELRLHIWHRFLRNPTVSDIHTHPWNFASKIITGRLADHVYREVPINSDGGTHWKQRLKCGKDCYFTGPRQLCDLRLDEVKEYLPGDIYEHDHEDIHCSTFTDFTVTLIHRDFSPGNRDYATVYWDKNEEWGSAEPRKAEQELVSILCKGVLRPQSLCWVPDF